MNSTLAPSTSSRTTASPAVGAAAIGAGAILLGFAGLQIVLAGGAPLGEHVWGGTQERVLPTGMRVAAGAAAIALTAAAGVVVHRAGLTGQPARWLSPATWGVAGYLALNTAGNFASSSDVERWLFGPATAIASALTAVVALRTRHGAST